MLQISPSRKKKFLTLQQTKKLLKSIDRSTLEGKRDFALISLMVLIGLRNKELIKVERGDLADCCGSHLLWVEEKDVCGKNQHIPLTDELFAVIQEYLSARRAISDSEPLFASHSSKNFGQSLTNRSVSRIIKKRLEYAKINDSRITADSISSTATILNALKEIKLQRKFGIAKSTNIDSILRSLKKIASLNFQLNAK